MSAVLTKPVAVCCDHAGFQTKKVLLELLQERGIEYKDYGTFGPDSCDYPDFAHLVGDAIDNREYSWGIAICGSGNGIQMTLNKHQSVRAALCWQADIARLARAHNDANVCAIPGRFVTDDEARQILNAFMDTPFEGGRHQARIDKIPLTK